MLNGVKLARSVERSPTALPPGEAELRLSSLINSIAPGSGAGDHQKAHGVRTLISRLVFYTRQNLDPDRRLEHMQLARDLHRECAIQDVKELPRSFVMMAPFFGAGGHLFLDDHHVGGRSENPTITTNAPCVVVGILRTFWFHRIGLQKLGGSAAYRKTACWLRRRGHSKTPESLAVWLGMPQSACSTAPLAATTIRRPDNK